MNRTLRPLGLLLLLLIVSAQAFPRTVLKMNHQLPPETVGSQLDQWFADQVFRETKREVKIEIYWSNALGEPSENLILLKNNAIDMAAMSPGYFPDKLPLHSAPNSIPMGMKNVCQSSRIMKALMENIPEFRQEASQNGIRALFFHPLNPYLLITKEPVTRFEDLKGLRIRTWGKDMPLLIKAAGARSVNLFLPDLYDALKHGVIDGCPFSTDLIVSYRIYELAKHVTEVVLWEGPGWGVWISEQSWHKLTPEHQQILLSVAEQTRQREVKETLEADKAARMRLKEEGVSFHDFPDSELAKWKATHPDFFQLLRQRLKQKGLGDAADKMIRIWKGMIPQISCPDSL